MAAGTRRSYHRMAARRRRLASARACTACDGTGSYIVGDWRSGYPTRTCVVCRGSGRMAKQANGTWGPA